MASRFNAPGQRLFALLILPYHRSASYEHRYATYRSGRPADSPRVSCCDDAWNAPTENETSCCGTQTPADTKLILFLQQPPRRLLHLPAAQPWSIICAILAAIAASLQPCRDEIVVKRTYPSRPAIRSLLGHLRRTARLSECANRPWPCCWSGGTAVRQ